MENISKQLFEEQSAEQFKRKFVFVPFEYPELLMSEPPSMIKLPAKQQQENRLSIRHTLTSQFQLRNKSNSPYKTHRQDFNSFFTIIKMFFPEIQGEGIQSLDIQVLDTIFYTSENTPIYIYNDFKKGLTKLKSKNYCDFFLKRRLQFQQQKAKIDKIIRTKDKYSQSFSNHSIISAQNWSLQGNGNKKEKGYIALLKYKDQSYVRLKQNDFKNIFYNPLHANQKFKNINNTQCFQMLPLDQENQTMVIDFSYNRFKNQKLFQLAMKLVCQQSSSSQRNLDIKSGKKLSKFLKQKLRLFNVNVQLYFITFQVYCYLSIHYSKKLEEASFYFTRNDSNGFSLSNINRIVIRSFNNGKEQFYRHSLIPRAKDTSFKISQNTQQAIETDDLQFFTQTQNIFGEKQKELTLLQQTIIQCFDKENAYLKKHLSSFVTDKFQGVKNSKDQKLSNMIFRTMNPNIKDSFDEILKDDDKFYDLIKDKKQKQSYFIKSVDGFSFVMKNAKKSQDLRPKLINNSKYTEYDSKTPQKQFNADSNKIKQSVTNIKALTKSRLNQPGIDDLFKLSKFYHKKLNRKYGNDQKGALAEKKKTVFSISKNYSVRNQQMQKHYKYSEDPNAAKNIKIMMKRIASASFQRA